MKKHILLTFSLLTLFCLSNIQAQDYPNYKEVVKRFSTVYSLYPGPEATKAVVFEKHPDGYYVAWNDFKLGKNIDRELFWSRVDNEFKEIKGFIRGISSKNTEIEKDLLHPTLLFLYDLEPYFGYAGWEDDAVVYLESHTERPIKEEYALGKAYGSMAQKLVDARIVKNIEAKKIVPLSENAFSPEEIDAYRNFQKLAADAKKRVYDAEPNFNTLNGLIGTDYSNQIMMSYLNLRFMANPKEARKELKSGLYSKDILNHAANLLLSCPIDGILFTLDDNDTYPLLYLQETESLRRDVSVVNMALLKNGRYANHFRQPIFNEKPVLLSANQAFYENGTDMEVRPYLLNQDTLSMANWILLCAGREPSMNGTKSVYVAPSKYIEIPIGGKTIWQYGMNGMLYANNVYILDVFYSNRESRQSCFTASIQLRDYLPLVPFLTWEGLVYSLVQQKSIHSVDQNNPTVGLRNLAYNDSLINNVFRWTPSTQQIHDHGQKSYISYTQYLCYEVARQHNAQGNKEKALAVLTKYFDHYPEIDHEGIVLGYYLWSEYQKCTKDMERSKKIVESLTNELEAVPPANWYYYKGLAEVLHKELSLAGWDELARRIVR